MPIGCAWHPVVEGQLLRPAQGKGICVNLPQGCIAATLVLESWRKLGFSDYKIPPAFFRTYFSEHIITNSIYTTSQQKFYKAVYRQRAQS